MSILNCTPNGREISGTLAAKNAIGCIFRAQGVASRSPISGAIFPRPTASALLSI